MKKIDFTHTGGFPMKQYTLNKMQDSFFELFFAVLNFIGVNTTAGNYILTGCVSGGGNITPGWVFMDGELIYFAGSAGDDTTKLLKNITAQSVAFKNAANHPVYYTSSVVIDASGTALSAFTRVAAIPIIDPDTVIDAAYVHTDNNFTTALMTHLMGIEPNAEVNVQSDWDVTDQNDDAYIWNKPDLVQSFYDGEIIIPILYTTGTTQSIGVNFPAPVPNANYKVIGQLLTISEVLAWNTMSHTINGFVLRCISPSFYMSSVKFKYTIIPD